eukprot:3077284-Rhodomonas_salina.1
MLAPCIYANIAVVSARTFFFCAHVPPSVLHSCSIYASIAGIDTGIAAVCGGSAVIFGSTPCTCTETLSFSLAALPFMVSALTWVHTESQSTTRHVSSKSSHKTKARAATPWPVAT